MSGNWNAVGDWDAQETVFTEDEIEQAVEWRQKVWPDPRLERKDRCPHTPMCGGLDECVRFIAWYFRHRRVIQAREVVVSQL